MGETYHWQFALQDRNVAAAFAMLILAISIGFTLFFLYALRVPKGATDMTAVAAEAPAAVRPMRAQAGNLLFIAGVVLLCAWVLLPIYLLLVNALSSPDEVTGFPEAVLPVLRFRQPRRSSSISPASPGRCGTRCWSPALTMVLSIGIGAPAGYALSRFDFPGKEAFRFLVLMTRAFPLPLLALPLAVMFIRTGLDDTAIGPRARPHHAGAALRGADHLLALLGHSARARGGGLDARLHPAAGVPQGGPAAGAAGHRGVGGLRLHHLLERGLRRGRADHREPDADRVPAAEPQRLAAATSSSPAARRWSCRR